MPVKGEKHLKRLRRICSALPETTEKLSHGEPTFFCKKVFAMCSFNHHNDGHIAVTVPAPPGIQQMLIDNEPEKYYKPPYVGGAGWIGIELDLVSDEELEFHIRQAWRLIAPKKLLASLETTSLEAKRIDGGSRGISSDSEKKRSKRTQSAPKR